ncbi:Ig-like domain-containing protein [soil metagenome]
MPVGTETTLQPDPTLFATAPGISRIEIVPADLTLKSGEKRRFVARVYDESGAEVASPTVAWYSMGGQITPDGEFFGVNEGERTVLALVNGAMATTSVTVLAPEIASLSVFTDVPSRVAAGSALPLEFHALNSANRWEFEPAVEIVSSAPDVVSVDGRMLHALKPGRATVTLTADQANESYAIEVVPAAGNFAITGAPEGEIRTGDVVTLGTSVAAAQPLWSVSGDGAEIYPNGDFVAEKAGRYIVVAKLGDAVSTASIQARDRGLTGRVHIVGHGMNPDMYTADIWPQNGYVYMGTHQANQIRTYDVSDPANPVLTDSVSVDARVINSVKVSEDGKWLAATREGATNRRNGILFYSLEDPAHPRLVSEYTETVTSGVHNVFWVGDLLYATNDGTGDMHIIDLSDPASPKEIGRWGIPVVGKSLHDIWAQDDILYMSYMMDGLVIMDLGGAGKGGTPEKPVLVSRIFYPDGPTHNALRNHDYVFIGDEDFSLTGTKPGIEGLSADPRGEVHVIDVTDLEHPVYAARYDVPEAGAHNFWIRDDVLYVGFYQGGIRAVDISGDLRGDLYRQGREIAHFLPAAGPEDAKLPYSPMTWGVYPMFTNGWQDTGGTLFATDYNSGLWSFTVELPEEPIS